MAIMKDIPFKFDDRTLQHESELRAMVDFVCSQSRIHSVIEIGSYEGGTALVWAQLARKVVCVDIESDPDKTGLIYAETGFEGKIVEIRGKSTDPAVIEKVRESLLKKRADLLFIDGDHGYHTVKADFKNYSQFIRLGGWIAMHDIVNPKWSMKLFWDELKKGREHWEFVVQRQIPHKKKTAWGLDHQMGIGLVRKE